MLHVYKSFYSIFICLYFVYIDNIYSMSSFIAIIGKDSTENLDICIESLCFGVTTKGNTANSHAKEAQVGDKLYFCKWQWI